MRHLFKLVSGLALACTLAGFGPDALAARSRIFEPIERSKVAAPRFDIKSQGMPIAIDHKRIAAIAPNDEMELALPGAATFVVAFDRVEDHGGGIVSRVGYLRDHGKEYRVIITSGPGGTYGSVRTPDSDYRIVPGTGSDWLVDMKLERALIPPIDLGNDAVVIPKNANDLKKAAPVASVNERLPADGALPAVNQATPTPQAVIDLLIVYTDGVANHLGSGLMTRLYNLVTAANTAYADSEVAMTLRLVSATKVTYTEGGCGDQNTALNAITPALIGGVQGGTGVFAGIEALRTSVGADMVSFLRDGSDFGGCGLAWISSSFANATYMYSVVNGCITGCDSVFIHELGHNMGNAHDRATAAFQQGGTATPSAGAFSYSFGQFVCGTGALNCNPFVPNGTAGGCTAQPKCSDTTGNFINPDNIGTIMSYFNPVTLKFSNPNLTCTQPGAAGATQPCGVAGTIDNALSMNNMRASIAALKATKVTAPTGALQFSAVNFSVQETAGMATITVSRVGGTGGAVSVNYATQDGTAKAGFDYTATSGTLNWADGDAADKAILVPIVNDGVTEGTEAFSVLLSNPTGATGVFLGFPTIAAVQITEVSTPWPPGGTFPAGFTSTTTNSASIWSLENTAANCDVGQAPCLVSPQVLATATDFQTYDYSDLIYVTPANAPAGTISFTYHVSSLATSFANLQFLINGVVAFSSAGGDTGWLATSVPFVGGSSTLTWRFRNDVYFPCAIAISPTPPANCRDRAWIDNVAIPAAVISSSTALGSSANPSASGASVTFSATISGTAGTPVGVVNFKDNGVVIPGCSLVATAAGIATCTTSNLSVGSHPITAEYSGNATYDTSISNTVSQVVSGMALTVTKSGTGAGTVTGTGINCGADCSEAVAPGTVIVLTATPNSGSIFAGWSGGGCAGTGTCSVTINSATSVNAVFTALITLTVTPAGTGTGTVTGTGITCGVDCSEALTPGTMVVLTATPSGGSSFAGWSGGGCAGTGTCTVTLNAATTVTATFTLLPVTLTVAKSGAGAGTVTGTGIACGVDCSESVAPGTMITLTASPSPGSNFTGWSGGGCAGTGTCTVTVNAATTVTAVFSLQQFVVSVSPTGTGVGTVTSAPAGISCGATCSANFDFGTALTLTAAAGANSLFAGWSGGGCSGTGTCSFSVGAATAVNAVFVDLPGPPTGVVATPGNGFASISFTPPAGVITPITGYTATCTGTGGNAVSGSASPILVSPLTNGNLYACSVTATNANGTGAASASAAVTPSLNPPVALIGVTSRKNHGAAGDHDLPVQFATPLAGALTVEPRTSATGHTLRFLFNVPVSSVGAATVTDGVTSIGSASASADGSSTVTVTLTGVPDNRRALVSVNAINGGAYVAQATIGFLVGDVSGGGSVNASDLSAIKARNGQPAADAGRMYLFDINRSGTVDPADLTAAKTRSGLRLPP